jgi:hypothetical protein
MALQPFFCGLSCKEGNGHDISCGRQVSAEVAANGRGERQSKHGRGGLRLRVRGTAKARYAHLEDKPEILQVLWREAVARQRVGLRRKLGSASKAQFARDAPLGFTFDISGSSRLHCEHMTTPKAWNQS